MARWIKNTLWVLLPLAAVCLAAFWYYPPLRAPAPEQGQGTAFVDYSEDLVDLNTAGPADLTALPGIGAARAAAIVAYRQQNGPFEDVEELVQVEGIGPAILEQVRPYVTV